jgi:hypothetical protein
MGATPDTRLAGVFLEPVGRDVGDAAPHTQLLGTLAV